MTLSEIIKMLGSTPEMLGMPPEKYSIWRVEFMREITPNVLALHGAGWRSGYRVNGFLPA